LADTKDENFNGKIQQFVSANFDVKYKDFFYFFNIELPDIFHSTSKKDFSLFFAKSFF
jgi:hypothetical protein